MLRKHASELRRPDSGQDPVLPSEDQSGGPERRVAPTPSKTLEACGSEPSIQVSPATTCPLPLDSNA